jgi:adenylosuccinate lyase
MGRSWPVFGNPEKVEEHLKNTSSPSKMDWSDRYSTPLSEIFSRKYKLSLEWRVELALLAGLEEVGKIPRGTHAKAQAVIDSGKVTLERTLAIESETHHDIMAMVKAISEQCDLAYPSDSPSVGGFIHYGATSQDVNDTVTALQLKECKARASRI